MPRGRAGKHLTTRAGALESISFRITVFPISASKSRTTVFPISATKSSIKSTSDVAHNVKSSKRPYVPTNRTALSQAGSFDLSYVLLFY